MVGIGSKMEQNPQLQECAERLIAYTFDLARFDELFIEDITDDMGITTDEMWNLYEQLGYERDGDNNGND